MRQHSPGTGGRVAVEDGEAERARVHAALRIGAQVVPAEDPVAVEQRRGRAVGDVHDVAPGADDTAVGVHRDAADAPPLRNDRVDRARRLRRGTRRHRARR